MRKIRILCYHNVSNEKSDYNMTHVSVHNFRDQMKYIKENYDVVRLEDVYKEVYMDSRDAVAITFDDGYHEIFVNALPILEYYNIPATVFVTTGNIGTNKENWTDNIVRSIFEPTRKRDYFEVYDNLLSGRWFTQSQEERYGFYRNINYFFKHLGKDKRKYYENLLLKWAGLTEYGREYRKILSENELRELSDNALISIGTHTVTHPSLNNIDVSEQEWEIVRSKKTIEDIIQKEVSIFAYPFGTKNDFSEATIELLKKHNFKMAVSTMNQEFTGETSCYCIPRQIMYDYAQKDIYYYFEKVLFANNSNLFDMKINAGNNLYAGKLENDTYLLNTSQNLIIWGCGYWGTELFDQLQLYNISKNVIAFGDNDTKKQGKYYKERPVLSKDQVLKLLQNEEAIVLVKNNQDLCICLDLVSSGINKIHLITR